MIPVCLQPEPQDFDENVRKKGHAWLFANGIALNAIPPNAADLPTHWRHSNKQLWEAYSGVCAYLAIYFEWVTGASSTDHFIAKSRNAGDSYEWSNFRLACLSANRNKNDYIDVFDPIGLQQETFTLNLSNGKISANAKILSAVEVVTANNTIARLKLNSQECQDMRVKFYRRYLKKKDEDALKELAPFIWFEAQRQGLL